MNFVQSSRPTSVVLTPRVQTLKGQNARVARVQVIYRPPKADIAKRQLDVRFSNRPAEVKRFQAIHHNSVEVAREHTLLFGIGTRPLYGAFLVKKFNQGDSTLDAVG